MKTLIARYKELVLYRERMDWREDSLEITEEIIKVGHEIIEACETDEQLELVKMFLID